MNVISQALEQQRLGCWRGLFKGNTPDWRLEWIFYAGEKGLLNSFYTGETRSIVPTNQPTKGQCLFKSLRKICSTLWDSNGGSVLQGLISGIPIQRCLYYLDPPPPSSPPASAKCGRCKTPAPDTSAASAATCFHADQNTEQLIWNKWSGLQNTTDTDWQIVLWDLCNFYRSGAHVVLSVVCRADTFQMCSLWLTVWL